VYVIKYLRNIDPNFVLFFWYISNKSVFSCFAAALPIGLKTGFGLQNFGGQIIGFVN